jgi:hypothetical protein
VFSEYCVVFALVGHRTCFRLVAIDGIHLFIPETVLDYPRASSWEICYRYAEKLLARMIFYKIRKFEKTRGVKFQLMILHF